MLCYMISVRYAPEYIIDHCAQLMLLRSSRKRKAEVRAISTTFVQDGLQEVIVSRTMASDHFPDHVVAALTQIRPTDEEARVAAEAAVV